MFQEIRQEILEKLELELNRDLCYHDLAHTLSVEEAVIYYSQAENVDEEGVLNLRYAALFHDAGYLEEYHENEENGVRIMRSFLERYNVDEDSIREISSIILATQHGHDPSNLLEEIICDADHDYLGTPNYIVQARNLYEEMLCFGADLSEEQWLRDQVTYLKNHHCYYTNTAIERRQNKKENWIKYLESQLPE